MRLLIIALLMNMASATELPREFYLNNQTGFDVNSINIEEAASSLEDYFVAEDHILNEMNFANTKENTKWKFTGFSTTLGISSTGKIGLIGLKGSAFTEIIWKKKGPSQKLITDDAILEDESTEIVINDLSNEAIEENVENAFSLVKASGKVTNLELAKISIREKILEFTNMSKAIQTDSNKKYYFAGIRFDLVIGASGTVATTYNVGGSVLLRMIYRPIRKINQKITATQIDNSNELQKTIADTATALDSLDESNLLNKKGYKLQMIRVGYGKSASGKINLINAKSSLVFSVLYARNPKYTPPGNSLISQTFLTKEIGTDESSAISWELFKKGLNKSLKISKPFINRAERKKSAWEISILKLTFSASATKGIGLVTVGDIGQVQLTYSK